MKNKEYYTKRNHLNKIECENQIALIDEMSFANLIIALESYKEKLQNVRDEQKGCKSDATYWVFENKIQLYKACLNYISDKIFDLIKDTTSVNYEKNYEKAKVFYEKKDSEIQNLQTYKPNGYKKIIEVINRIFKQ